MAAVLKYFVPQAAPYHANKKRYGRDEAQARVASTSKDVYVGNLAFVTTDYQLHSLFSRCGPIERVVMGLNKATQQPAGFAFIIFVKRESAMDAVNNLDGTQLDEKVIKVEMHKGFFEGQQFGKGITGAQIRDENRIDYDGLRGGILDVAIEKANEKLSSPAVSNQPVSRYSSGGAYRGRGGGRGRGGARLSSGGGDRRFSGGEGRPSSGHIDRGDVQAGERSYAAESGGGRRDDDEDDYGRRKRRRDDDDDEDRER